MLKKYHYYQTVLSNICNNRFYLIILKALVDSLITSSSNIQCYQKPYKQISIYVPLQVFNDGL